ncbi:hypothetical protein NBRC116601_19540 [Cognatishimia sp. WU-CL00825]|uniref:FAD-binding oxidoreductase n=1 Tax=Cognatishimia sp. WU-CL00825 TaxID=3127658 RepID=UPI003109D3DC
MDDQISPAASPFHKGEQDAQTRAGKRDRMETIGKMAIRDFMPEQHRNFFEQLPFIVIGSVDDQGWPWASILSGGEGSIVSPSDRQLVLNAKPLAADPLSKGIEAGAPIGLLGIELGTRRRNRMNARVARYDNGEIHLDVVQSFGNCPQYIQTRDVNFIRPARAEITREEPDHFRTFDAAAQTLISESDTFFVSSYISRENGARSEGVDVSHRGGRAGFVKVEGNTLTIPDYSGNNFFNTIGNFLMNPKAGLIFPDFQTGDVLMLTGTVDLLWEDAPEIAAFKGAERGWRFALDHGIRIADALPFRAKFGQWSPNSLMADDWATSQARMDAEKNRVAWRSLQVVGIKDESSVIRSFEFAATDDIPLLPFEAGQFLTLRVDPENAPELTRSYTVSSAPGDANYRISVKREPSGTVSNYLHNNLRVGDIITAKAPNGAFFLDPKAERPAVLIAGGVGITPMMAMTRHVLNEGLRTRYVRPLTIIHAAQTTEQRAFYGEFRKAEALAPEKIRYLSVIGRPRKDEQQAVDFDASGYVTKGLIQQALLLDDYDFYLCGPPAFMQAIYDMLRALGVADSRLFAEAFGPASLSRAQDAGPRPAAAIKPVAGKARVRFDKSGLETTWKRGDETLLATAEAQGLSPAFSCRNGTCGNCATKKLAGDVTYNAPVTAAHDTDEVLICCAVPAASSETLVLDL